MTATRNIFTTFVLVYLNISSRKTNARSTTKAFVSDDPTGAKLLVLLFDGFRYDYLEKADTPNFDRLVENGVKPESAIPAFMTKTYPGQNTIATGLYQESHGILGNRMYDPVFDATFNVATMEPRWWDNGGEPIWITYQKSGGKTASVYYVSDSVNISGYTATYHVPNYVESMPFEDRVEFVLGYMGNGSANLGLLYFHEPDEIAHEKGPDSVETAMMIKTCDNHMGYLLDRLTDVGLMNIINIIVVSDHGFANVFPNQTVFLDEYIDPNLYFYTDNNPVFGIWPHEDSDIQVLYDGLVDKHPHMTVYLKNEIPVDLHYSDNRRISPIVVVVDEGWHVWTNRSKSGAWATYKGNHGFLNTYKSMEHIFIASGPAFKTGLTTDTSINTVDIYNLMCHVLSISPAPNNGTFSNVKWMLKDRVDISTVAMTTSSAHRFVAPVVWVLWTVFSTVHISAR